MRGRAVAPGVAAAQISAQAAESICEWRGSSLNVASRRRGRSRSWPNASSSATPTGRRWPTFISRRSPAGARRRICSAATGLPRGPGGQNYFWLLGDGLIALGSGLRGKPSEAVRLEKRLYGHCSEAAGPSEGGQMGQPLIGSLCRLRI
jgi:hypothetical protein